MKLLFLYGPPASGKACVAREISEITGMRVLSNRSVADFAGAVLPAGSPAWVDLSNRLRLDTIEAAAREGVSLILTTVFAKGEDDEMAAQIVKAVERHRGKVVFVQLLPVRETLQARANKRSRRKNPPQPDWNAIERFMEAYDVVTPIEGSLTIDESNLPAASIARRIVDRLRLKP